MIKLFRQKDKKGITGILLTAYLMALLFIIASVLYTAINAGIPLQRAQLDIFQSQYYLERGIYYAVWNLQKTPPELYSGAWPPSQPDEAVTITTSQNGSSYDITASRNGRTLKASYGGSLMRSFGPSAG